MIYIHIFFSGHGVFFFVQRWLNRETTSCACCGAIGSLAENGSWPVVLAVPAAVGPKLAAYRHCCGDILGRNRRW